MNEPHSWYYAEGEQTLGPVPDSDVEALIQQSVIVPTTWMLAEGSENWMLAHDSPFKDCFQTEPVESAKVESPSLPADTLSVTASQEKVSNKNDRNKILQNAVTLVLKWLLAVAEWSITALLNVAKRIKNFSYYRQGQPLIQSGWNKRKIMILSRMPECFA